MLLKKRCSFSVFFLLWLNDSCFLYVSEFWVLCVFCWIYILFPCALKSFNDLLLSAEPFCFVLFFVFFVFSVIAVFGSGWRTVLLWFSGVISNLFCHLSWWKWLWTQFDSFYNHWLSLIECFLKSTNVDIKRGHEIPNLQKGGFSTHHSSSSLKLQKTMFNCFHLLQWKSKN